MRTSENPQNANFAVTEFLRSSRQLLTDGILCAGGKRPPASNLRAGERKKDRWRLRKARSLIKLLALAPEHRLHRGQVLEALWPDLGTHNASNNLHQILHAVRRALEPSVPPSSSVAASSSGYLLLSALSEQVVS